MAEGIVHVVAKFLAKPGQEAALKDTLLGLSPDPERYGFHRHDLYVSAPSGQGFVPSSRPGRARNCSHTIDTPLLIVSRPRPPSCWPAPMT